MFLLRLRVVIYARFCDIVVIVMLYYLLLRCRASDFPREYDGACVQMRMSYSPAAQFFLFFVQWSDCHLAGALGLLRILIFQVKIETCSSHFVSGILMSIIKVFGLHVLQVYADGTTTMSTHERKASIREFYGMIQKVKHILLLFTVVKSEPHSVFLASFLFLKSTKWS